MRFRKQLFFMAILAGIVSAGLAAPAQAAGFRMRVEVLAGTGAGTGFVITDEVNETGAAGTFAGVPGAILLGGTIGQFTVTSTTGVSKPIIGSPVTANYAELDLDNISINVGGAGTIRISLEDTGYTAGPNGPMTVRATVGGVLTAPAGSTINLRSWADPTNSVPDYGADTNPAGALAALGAIPGSSVEAFGGGGATFGPGAFGTVGNNVFTKAGTYSLFSQVVVTFTGAGSVSFNDHQETLPAPAGMVLALAALPGFGLAWLRRRLKKG